MKRVAASVAVSVVCLLAASCGSGGDGSGAAGPTGALTDARQYNLQRINALRAQNGSPPLVLDDALNTFSQAASVELSNDHSPHAYFSSHFGSCGCSVQAENQGDPNGWTVMPIQQQIDDILNVMMSEGPGGGHHDNILNPRSTRLGVGIVNPGGALYFTNDFGP